MKLKMSGKIKKKKQQEQQKRNENYKINQPNTTTGN